MTDAHATPGARPRAVTVAFVCWVIAGVLLVLFGMLLISARTPQHLALRGFGVLFVVAGLALGYIAGRARTGSAPFRRAGVGLAFAVGVLQLLLFGNTVFGVPIAVLGALGALLMLRPASSRWFTACDHRRDGA